MHRSNSCTNFANLTSAGAFERFQTKAAMIDADFLKLDNLNANLELLYGQLVLKYRLGSALFFDPNDLMAKAYCLSARFESDRKNIYGSSLFVNYSPSAVAFDVLYPPVREPSDPELESDPESESESESTEDRDQFAPEATRETTTESGDERDEVEQIQGDITFISTASFPVSSEPRMPMPPCDITYCYHLLKSVTLLSEQMLEVGDEYQNALATLANTQQVPTFASDTLRPDLRHF